MTGPIVYLLHFERPFWHARHYAGIALDGDVQRRLQEHLSGHGSPLVRAVVAAGIRVDLVLALPGDRGLERRFHNAHGTRVCPRCTSQRPPRPRPLRLPSTRPPAPRRGRRPPRSGGSAMPLPERLPDLAAELAGIRHALARLAAVAQQPTEPQPSVEIARNSKGATWTVKVYAHDPVEASTFAQGLYDQLAHRYGGTEREREP